MQQISEQIWHQRKKVRSKRFPTVAPTGEKNVHTLFLRPKKRTFGEGRPSQAGWVQVGPWKAGGGYQRLTYGEPWGNLRVTFGIFPSHLGPILADFS